MGFVDGLLLNWRVALSSVRGGSEGGQTMAVAIAVTVLTISLTIVFASKLRHTSSPATIMLEGHIVSRLLEAKDGWLKSLLVNPASLIHGMSPRRAIIVDPAFGQAVLRKPQEVMANDDFQWALQTRVFGSRKSVRPTVTPILRGLFGAISRQLLSETGVKPVVRATNLLLGEKVMDFVPSLTTVGPLPAKEIEKRPWLRNADAQVGPDGTITIDLCTSIRDFTMYISTYILAGSDFVKVYPEVIEDLFMLDAGFGPLGLGFPTWFPLGLIRRAVNARKRIIAGLTAFAERLEAVATGTADAALQARMADVNPIFFERSALYRSKQMSFEDRAGMDVAVIWAMNANTSPAAFWMVGYLVTHADALQAIKQEVAPYVDVLDKTATVDTDGLLYRCPRLKAAWLEIMRLASEPSSIRHVSQDFTVSHPTAKKPMSFRRDAYLTVAHTVSQRDPEVYPEPEAFRPERFLVKVADPNETNEANGDTYEAEANGKPNYKSKQPKPHQYVHSMLDPSPVRATYGNLKPWGDGPLMCKGRLFAEREMLVEVALLLSAWDITPLDATVPNHLPGTGVVNPDRPMRATIRRRKVAATE